MASKTTLSYLGFDFDIGTKNPQHITLFFETAPNLPDVIAYLKENYGNVNATASKPFQSPYHWVTSAEVKHMEKQQDELKSQKIEYTFIPKPQKELILFPQLPPLPQDKLVEDFIMRDINDQPSTTDVVKAYQTDLVKKAKAALSQLKKKNVDFARVLALEETIDKFESICREAPVESPKRLDCQTVLENLLKSLANEFNL